jgi:Domain of unknown function (DUF222)/HNH endonuclease
MGATRLQALESELAQQQAHMNAAMARWLRLLGEFDRRGDLAGDPLERWVAWRFGHSYREAAELVRVARALVELPVIRAAFERGELTLSKVRALTRVATPACEARLLRLACVLTAPQLDRALRVYQRVTAAQAQRQHEFEYVTHYWEDDGTLFLQARLAAEDGTLLVKALDAARERIRERRRKQPPAETAEPSWTAPRPFEPPRSDKVEALLELAHQSLNPEARQPSRQRPQLVVHVDAAKLAHDAPAPGRCELHHGPVIAPETARRLGCDATTITVTESNGRLRIGRRRRTIPPKLRKALEARDDGSCQWPGCTNTHYLDAHHKRHWAHGGATNLDNLILLCSHHHRLLHEGGYTIHPHPDVKNGIQFKNRYGIAVPTVPRSPPGNADALANVNKQAGLTITDTTNKNGTDEHPDPDQTNDALTTILG